MNAKYCYPFLLSALLLTGCAPSGQESPLSVPVDTQNLGLINHSQNMLINSTWWQALNDSALNQLIEQTLLHSPDLAIATARLAQAQAGSALAGSQRGPQLAISADGAGIYHESLSHPNSILAAILGDTVEFGRVQLKGRWVWDLWGMYKSELTAALGKEKALAYEIAQTRLLLAQAVTAQYLQLQMIMSQQTILNDRLSIKQQQLRLLTKRVEAGLVPASQLYVIQNAQLQMQSALQDLQQQADKIRHVLAALSAQAPQQLVAIQSRQMPLLSTIAVEQLTTEIIGQRADILAQKEALLAKGHLIDAAKAKFYPNIQISALAGLSALQISDFPSSRTLLATIMPSVSLPIFTSGALQANLRLKQAEYNEQVARYNKSVYTALQEAADALSLYQSAKERVILQQKTVVLTERLYQAAKVRKQAGLDTEIAVLTAQDEVLQARSQLLQLTLLQNISWVSLNVAFGGGVN